MIFHVDGVRKNVRVHKSFSRRCLVMLKDRLKEKRPEAGLTQTALAAHAGVVLGGLIGGVILVYRLAVAAWYLPLTIYRLIT